MDIILNDGTEAKNVSVWEYEQLKEKGLVGNKLNIVSTNQLTNTDPNLQDFNDKYSTVCDKVNGTKNIHLNYYRCWKCGCELNDDNRAELVFPTYPPKYACKKCF